jgi:hypothetical protein
MQCLTGDWCLGRVLNNFSTAQRLRKNLREMRSKHFFSSGLVFTWQVKRLSFAGGRLACLKTNKKYEMSVRGGGVKSIPCHHSWKHSKNRLFNELAKWLSEADFQVGSVTEAYCRVLELHSCTRGPLPSLPGHAWWSTQTHQNTRKAGPASRLVAMDSLRSKCSRAEALKHWVLTPQMTQMVCWVTWAPSPVSGTLKIVFLSRNLTSRKSKSQHKNGREIIFPTSWSNSW